MQLGVEISLYPLNEEYIPHIKGFIDRLNEHSGLHVNTSHTSTFVSGDYDVVMDVMNREMKKTYEQVGQAIFVCKFLNSTNMAITDAPYKS